MPQKRSSNEAKKNSSNAKTTPKHAAQQNDAVGVALAILAAALLVSLVMPTEAFVTHAVERILTLSFGVGAILAPVTLFLYAVTFFIEGEEPFGTRAALGLFTVMVSVLSLISVFVPGAEQMPALVFDATVLEQAGGYVGGAVAWTLLTLVGKWVGVVLIVGLAILGIIICGFSVSAFVVRVREGAVHVNEVRETAREQRVQWRQESQRLSQERASLAAAAAVSAPVAMPAPSTTFIGGRKASVLKRSRRKNKSGQGSLPFDEGFDVKVDNGFVDEFIDEDDLFAEEAPAEEPAPTKRMKRQKPAKTKTQRKGKAGEPTEDLFADELDDTAPFAAIEPTEAQPAPKKGRAKGQRRTPETPEAARAQRVTSDDPSKKRAANEARKAAASAAAQVTSSSNESEVNVPEFLRNPSKGKVRPSTANPPRPGDDAEGYQLPPMSMLSENPNSAGTASSSAELEETKERLQGTLREFGLSSRVVDYVAGPIVTTFRIEMGEGERVNRIRSLEDDIALTLAAEKVRIFAPIPGTSYVGIEIPNKSRQNVQLGDVLPHAAGGPLVVAIGRDSAGAPVVADIAQMPHMLVAGTTGSGKSVMINSIIMSLLMRTTPKQVRLILVDPKRVEFSCYNGLPHLYVPVVTEPRQAASALQWAVSEMERRLKMFERAGAREIKVYNKMCTSGKFDDQENPPEPLPYLVVVIDELSDLMMVAGKDVEASIVRIAQLARAAGIHLIIATQRPSANVVTGLIKSNIDNRIALKVSSGIDSRVILDETGAERLLGNGDMLFKYRGLNMRRVLGCYTSDAEINSVVDFIRDQAEPDYHTEILSAVMPAQNGGGGRMEDDGEDDPLVWEAAQIVVDVGYGSTSGLQRRLKVGYARAGRIMDMLENKGVVGPASGSKPREVLIDEEGLEELKTAEAAYRGV